MKVSDEAKPQGRSHDVHHEELIIVGAGQAGLSMGYWLKWLQRSFLLLEAGQRIGESGRQRYDFLVLFTPRRYSALPGLAFPGDPEGCPTKDEMADYLQTYADHIALPIQMDTGVVGMQKRGTGSHASGVSGCCSSAVLCPTHAVGQRPLLVPGSPSPPGSRWRYPPGKVAQSTTRAGVGPGT